MSRFLIVVPPLVGHVNPTVPLAAELTARGHEVAWAGDPETVTALVGPAATVFPCARLSDEAIARPPELRGTAAWKFLWEGYLLPMAEVMADGVTDAVREFRPDVLLADQQALAGGLVAERLGIPWATSATTSAELIDPLAERPKFRDWLDDRLAALRSTLGIPESTVDPRFADRLIVAFSTRELVGDTAAIGEQVRFVGPSIGDRPSSVDFPWAWLDGDAPVVLVSLGTANADAGGRFLRACADAVTERAGSLRAVIVDPLGELSSTDDVLAVPRVPQLALLPHVDAVVSHSGHNTVCETLANGKPLVVAPIRDDQPLIAEQVVAAGAGIRVRFNRATPAVIGAALEKVLTEPGYRAAAATIRESFAAAGGAPAAAEELLALAAGRSAQSGRHAMTLR